MDSRFGFLDDADARLVSEVLARRNPALADRVQRSELLSRNDADEIVTALGDEFVDNLDEHWEPTDYGRTVSRLQARVNTARIATWPE